jgi:hypothetical protein
MILLRALARVVGSALMLVLALFGLGVAMYCVDALVGLGSARPDRLLDLPGVRDHVGRFLDQVAASGSIARLALLCGLGAMFLGVLLLLGILGRRKRRLVVLEDDGSGGVIAARTTPLQDMARALTEPTRSAESTTRIKLSPTRHGTQGTLRVTATRTSRTDPRELEADVQKAVAPITEPFHLKPRVQLRVGESGSRAR